MNYGYVRVSTTEQNIQRQVVEIEKHALPRNVFIDKVSGKDFNRPQYKRLRRTVCPGDVIFIKSLDRLGRNYEMIQDEWRYLTKKGIDIVILDMPLLDTRNKTDLIGRVISDIVLQLLSYVSQTEREFIRQRQAEGIALAKARGVHMGRAGYNFQPDQIDLLYEYSLKRQNANDYIENIGISKQLFYKTLKRIERGEILGGGLLIMKIYAKQKEYTIYHGSMLDMLQVLEPNSVDAIICDPPYELGFMSRTWDSTGIAFQKETWEVCLRVLKPGGHLLAFGGSRTFHRIAVGIENGGFEIRDTIMWMYGTGFPKSIDLGFLIDRGGGTTSRATKTMQFCEWLRSTGVSKKELDRVTGTQMSSHWTSNGSQPARPTKEQWEKIKTILTCEIPDYIEEMIEERAEQCEEFLKREVVDIREKGGDAWHPNTGEERVTKPFARTRAHSKNAKQWEGWGFALKPAYEPIIVARKPFQGSLIDNVMTYGNGGINIDACRIEIDEEQDGLGRFPSNVLHDGVALESEEWSRYFYSAKASSKDRDDGLFDFESGVISDGRDKVNDTPSNRDATARKNIHPTVKPVELMQYLVRLVCVGGGLFLIRSWEAVQPAKRSCLRTGNAIRIITLSASILPTRIYRSLGHELSGRLNIIPTTKKMPAEGLKQGKTAFLTSSRRLGKPSYDDFPKILPRSGESSDHQKRNTASSRYFASMCETEGEIVFGTPEIRSVNKKCRLWRRISGNGDSWYSRFSIQRNTS